jgi:hypothetical protein
VLGCGKAADPPPAAKKDAAFAESIDAAISYDGVLAAMVGFTDRMCACKDAACVDKVNDEMVQSTVKSANAAPKDFASPTAEQNRRIAEVNARYVSCSDKIRAATLPAESAPLAPNSAACVAFKAAIDALASCAKTTPAIRKNLMDAYAAIDKTEPNCKQGIVELKEPADRMGCKLPP